MKTKLFSRKANKFKEVESINPDKPEVSDEILDKWQNVINIITDIIGVSAGLITEVNQETMKIILKSENEDNPFEIGSLGPIDSYPNCNYCKTVVQQNKDLYIKNSLTNKAWKDNPAINLDIISYCGLIIKWADGEIFGTICILDKKTMDLDEKSKKLLDEFRDVVEDDLILLEKQQKLEYQHKFQKTLAEISSDLLEINPDNIDRKLNITLGKIGDFFNVDCSYIFEFNNEDYSFSKTHEWCKKGITAQKQRLQNIEADIFPYTMKKMQNNEIINKKDLKNGSYKKAEQNLLECLNFESVIIKPIFIEHELFGFLGFDSVKNKMKFSGSKLRLLKIFTDTITTAFSRYLNNKRIRKLTYKDSLTGLYNRRFFEEELERLDTKRQLPISIIVADINGLKIVNDSLGHKKGDQLLKKSAEILKELTRKEDILARQGGDEFSILLPQTRKEKAEEIINRIKKKSAITKDDELIITMALGSSTKTNSNQNIEDILKKADNNMYQNKLSESKSTKSKIVQSLLNTLAVKSNETKEHAVRMKKLAFDFGEELKLSNSELNRLYLLSTLHDIGKITISNKILKKPDKLKNQEWKIIKEHSERGYKIASASEEFALVADEILNHHENWDGSGYPNNRAGKDIPYLARIISIIDAYDVMTNDRPYSKAISQEEALAEIENCSGSQFDPDLAEKFINLIV